MVAHLVRLKLGLLRNTFRRSRAQAVGAVIGIIYFTGLVVAVAVGLGALRGTPDAVRVVVPLAGAAGTVLWTVVPLLSFGSDPTLDPGRFATFAIPHRDLAVGLLAAALVGLPAIASTVLCVGVVVGSSQTLTSTLVALVGAAIGLLTAVTTSRWVSARMTRIISSRRGRDAVGVIGLLLLVLVGPAFSLLGNLGSDLVGLATTAARVVAWTPLGWAWAASGDVAAGDVGVGVVRLVLAAALLALVGWAWATAIREQVENPTGGTRSDASVSTGSDLGLLARLPGTPRGAVAARALTSWRRDPRYQVSLAMTPVLPLVLLIPFVTSDLTWTPLLMAPLLAFLLGWSEHNAVAYEGDALWLHLVAGLSGRDDRVGRLVPGALLSAVLLPVYAGVGVALAGRWDLLPAVVGLSVGVLGAGFGVSSVMSVVLPYPVPASGESPFSAPPGAAGITLGAQSLASLCTVVLAAPTLVLAWFAWQDGGAFVWLTGVAGVVLGAVGGLAGLRLGARLYDRRAPELLAALQR
ncbi:hypothetical protein GCM10023258_25880 [Terrabacter aeriphilus]|uniref:ABC-2 type transport system permease protein n=1 Tax=Terrabacter aeriphilus TaxID=515662 RepID=A0ABP9JEC0_9MICO